jgi:hypothetical protein
MQRAVISQGTIKVFHALGPVRKTKMRSHSQINDLHVVSSRVGRRHGVGELLEPTPGNTKWRCSCLRGKQEVCLQIYMEVLLLFQKLAEPRVPADFQLAIQFSLIW